MTESYRWKAETVGDLGSVASADQPEKIIEQFVEYEAIDDGINTGALNCVNKALRST